MIGISLYIFLGIIAGLLAGLLGLGGGVLIVPGLALIFNFLGIPPEKIMHMATSTSLASIIFTTLTAAIIQHRRGNIDWYVVWHLLPGIFLGVIGGTSLANALPNSALRIFFGIFLGIIAFHLLFKRKKSTEETEKPKPSQWLQLIAGVITGLLGGILGIGGGIFVIPVLLHLGLDVRRAMATSAVCAFSLSVIGTLNFMIMSWKTPSLMPGTTGYIFWPAAIIIAFTGIFFVPMGNKLANYLSTKALERVFAVFLLLIALDMLVRI